MLELFREAGYWGWLVFGFILLGLELLVPGAFMFWFGLAAIVTGLLLVVIPIGWQFQLLIFAVLAVSSIFLWRRFRPQTNQRTDQPFLNERGSSFIGQVFTIKSVENSQYGTIKINDTKWRVRAQNNKNVLSIGQKVEVVATDGSLLLVQPNQPNDDPKEGEVPPS